MSRRFRISFVEVASVIQAVNHFPPSTPKRWNLISQFVRISSGSCVVETLPTMELGSGATAIAFDRTEEHCKEAYQLLQSCSPAIFQYARVQAEVLFEDASHSAFKPIILLPGKMECCGKKVYIRYELLIIIMITHIYTQYLHVQVQDIYTSKFILQRCNTFNYTHSNTIILLFLFRNRPSFPLVYTTGGTFIAAAFSGTCTTCGKIIHHSSYETKSDTKDDKMECFFDPPESQYFQATAMTVFSTSLLDQVTHQIAYAAATFASEADVYNATYLATDQLRLAAYEQQFSRVKSPSSATTWKLNEKRLEDGWFLYRLVLFYREQGKLGDVNFILLQMPAIDETSRSFVKQQLAFSQLCHLNGCTMFAV